MQKHFRKITYKIKYLIGEINNSIYKLLGKQAKHNMVKKRC